MPRPTKEQAKALRDRWLLPLTVYFNQLAGPSHKSYLMSPALFKCISASNRAGKTTAMQADCVGKLLAKHPWKPNFTNRRILVVITRSDQAATVWGDRLLKKCGLPGEVGKLPWIDSHYVRKVTWQRSQKHGRYPGKIELINGSEYFMALAGDPDSWLALEGIPFDDIYRDEATGVQNMSTELEVRLLDAQTANARGDKPGAGGIDWGATETKDNEEYRLFKARCQSGIDDHAWFHFDNQDNSAVSQEVRAKAAERLSSEDFQVRVMGVGATTDRVKVVAPYWIPALHETHEPYRIRPDDNLWITFDPGWRDKCGILCSVISRDRPRHIRVVRWHSYKFGGYNNAVQDMKAWLDGRIATRIVCDAQIHASMQHNGRTYYTEFCDLLKTHKVECHADPLWAKPRIEDRLSNMQDCFQNHGDQYDPYRNSIEVDMTGAGCEAFVGELLNSRWQVDREGNVLKVMVQKNLESFDCSGYLIHQAPQWMDYGSQQALTDHPDAPQEVLDPDTVLFRARRAEADRIWEEEGLEAEGSPDQFGVFSL